MRAEVGRGLVFILSPASCGGRRAELLLSGDRNFDLALRLREPGGVELAEAFSFMSGLYFRGKLAYARALSAPPGGAPGELVVVPGRGLMSPEVHVGLADLRDIAGVPVDLADARYREPLVSDAARVASALRPGDRAVLLGSIATDKYLDPLLEAFGPALHVPEEFIGRGDMSRGGLLLRCADVGRHLTYIPAATAPRRGKRPPRLSPRSRFTP